MDRNRQRTSAGSQVHIVTGTNEASNVLTTSRQSPSTASNVVGSRPFGIGKCTRSLPFAMSIFDREDLYMDNYYEYPGFQDHNRQSSRNVTSGESADVYLVHSWTAISRFVLTILLRIGFLLVQIGSVPVTNVNLIMLQNMVDFSCVTLAYVLAGFVIAYTGDINGLMGEGRWIGHASTDKEEAIVGWQAIVIASAICTSCLVGRTHTVGYLFIGIVMAGLLQPLAIHWAWTPKGWMAHNVLHDRPVAFRDYGGSSIVHIVGSSTGLIGCIILGRRILRLRDIDDASVPADSAGNVFAGYSLILLGLQSLCLPSTSDNHPRLAGKHMSLVVVNNLLGASACSLLVVGLHFFLSREPFNHWTVMRCVQASVAGTVIVSAGVDVYSPIMCIGLGCTGGIVFYLVSRRVFESALEDYCNIVATHLTCALVGSFVAPFCRTSTAGLYDAHTMILSVAWQVICLVTIVTLVVVTMTVAFLLLECLGLLRNRSEFVNHLRAIVALQRGPSRSYMERLFYPDGETLYLQPGTAPLQRVGSIVGPRFANYQRAIAKLERSKPDEIVQATRKSLNPEINAVATNPSAAVETRVKKFRHIHTIRPTSDTGIIEAAGEAEAMGDNRIALDNEKETGRAIEEVTKASKIKSIAECSGDSSANPVEGDDDFLVERFAELNRVNYRIAVEKNLKRRREPYRLHRTQKCTNLRLEAVCENDNSVKFLVEPRPRTFASSRSDSEEDTEVVSKKYPRNFSASVPVALVRPTSESFDFSSRAGINK